MFCLNCKENIACENCGTETTNWNNARRKKSCSVGTILLQATSDVSKMSQADLNYLEKQKNIQACEQTTLTNVKLAWMKILSFERYENIGGVSMELD